MSLRMKSNESLFVVVDIQEKLVPVLYNPKNAVEVVTKLFNVREKLKIPYLVSEQYPKGIGHTLDILKPFIDPAYLIEKKSFSCMLESDFVKALENTKRKQIILCGMETHVCVLQTVLDLIDAGYQVFVVEDGVTSRTKENKKLGLDRMRQAGAQIVSSEMVIFEWLERAASKEFKSILPLIK